MKYIRLGDLLVKGRIITQEQLEIGRASCRERV